MCAAALIVVHGEGRGFLWIEDVRIDGELPDGIDQGFEADPMAPAKACME